MALTMEEIRARLQQKKGVWHEPTPIDENIKLWMDYTEFSEYKDIMRNPEYKRSAPASTLWTTREHGSLLQVLLPAFGCTQIDEMTYDVPLDTNIIPLKTSCYGINAMNVFVVQMANTSFEVCTFYRVDLSTDAEEIEYGEPLAFCCACNIDGYNGEITTIPKEIVQLNVGSAEWEFSLMAHGGSTWQA
ncbi:hypothetical protein [Aeromonas dhakensis]|uniref:hypothetical protein n=1 Tax=Aeromonas dhakensis TaxID=196024 RepID=UPI0012FDC010|nr:hypothetical protein [Aeromonas dhakensis]